MNPKSELPVEGAELLSSVGGCAMRERMARSRCQSDAISDIASTATCREESAKSVAVMRGTGESE